MGDLVNLRRARKAKARAEAGAKAAANRERFGEPGGKRALREARDALEARRLDGAKIQGADRDAPGK